MAAKTLTEPDAASLCCRGCRRSEGRSDSFAAAVICWAKGGGYAQEKEGSCDAGDERHFVGETKEAM